MERQAHRIGIGLAALAALSIAAVGIVIAGGPRPAPPVTAEPGPPPGAGADDFLAIAGVLLSPRCKNCHPAGDAPLQGDRGTPHAMNISRRSPAAGLPCTACHRNGNAPFKGGPPGVPNWHMPSAEAPMIFEGRTPRQLCEQLKDPTKTGNRTPEALHAHLRDDALVKWAWAPGPGRTTPPISHEELVRHSAAWVAAGAPCPP